MGANVSYRLDNIADITLPTAAEANALDDNKIYVTIFGTENEILKAGAKATVDIDNIAGSMGTYGVWVLGKQIWGNTRYLAGKCDEKCQECQKNCEKKPGDKREECKQNCAKQISVGEIWSSKDEEGNEKWSKEKKTDRFSKAFVAGPVPITVSALAKGEIGLRASLKIGPNNKLELEGGPYASLSGEADAGLGMVLTAGVGIELTFVEVFAGLREDVKNKDEIYMHRIQDRNDPFGIEKTAGFDRGEESRSSPGN